MAKISLDLEDSFEDFGFSAVSEDELKTLERQLQQQVEQKEQELSLTSKEYKAKLEALYKLIMPLLINLQKDDNKEYIYWPDRSKKMTTFIARVNKIVNDE